MQGRCVALGVVCRVNTALESDVSRASLKNFKQPGDHPRAHLASTLGAKVAATLLTAASVAAVPSLSQGADTIQRSLDPSLSIQRHGTELSRDARVQVFVQLSEPSV